MKWILKLQDIISHPYIIRKQSLVHCWWRRIAIRTHINSWWDCNYEKITWHYLLSSTWAHYKTYTFYSYMWPLRYSPLWASQVVLAVKNLTAKCRRHKRCRFELWVWKIPWSRKWQPTPVFLLENSMDRGAWNWRNTRNFKFLNMGRSTPLWGTAEIHD